MMETESAIIKASLMFVALLLVMGSCINVFVKAVFGIGSDFEQPMWLRMIRITFWLGMGGFGSALVNICAETTGQLSNNFMTAVFDMILVCSGVFWLFSAAIHDEVSTKKVGCFAGKIIVYSVLYWALQYVFTFILQKRLVLGENWIWQLTNVLIYYFLMERAVSIFSNKIKEWNRVNRENGKIISDSGKISGSM